MFGWTIILLCFLLIRPSCSGSDNFVLLSGTLKTMQRAACDDEMVSLACPRGTAISIQKAQWRTSDERNGLVDLETESMKICLWPNPLQYSLLQTVVEACQKKPLCQFSTRLKPGVPDPCPNSQKIVEVEYKCRPSEFRSLIGCENDVIRLSCNPYSRVAVFDAQYGRTQYEQNSCVLPKGIPDETCKTPHSTETVMQLCHGKRRCEFIANRKVFGSPCKPGAVPYIKVVYACVPLGVITEKYESAVERDEVINGQKERDRKNDGFDDSETSGKKWGPNAITPVADPALQSLPDEDETDAKKVEDTMAHKPVLEEVNSEPTKFKAKVFLYVGIGVFIFCFLMLLLLGVRCYISRRTSRESKTGDMFSTEAPNVFNDAVSDIDNDIDVSHISGTFYDHPDMILYRDVPGSRGTLRAMKPLSTIYPCAGASMYGNVDFVPPREGITRFKQDDPKATEMLSPKSLRNYPNSSQFYYG